jgi:hypothetical protein
VTQIAVKQVLLKRGNDLVSIRDEVRMHMHWANDHIVKLLGFQDMMRGEAIVGIQMLMEYVSGCCSSGVGAQYGGCRCLEALYKLCWMKIGKVASRAKKRWETTPGRFWMFVGLGFTPVEKLTPRVGSQLLA